MGTRQHPEHFHATLTRMTAAQDDHWDAVQEAVELLHAGEHPRALHRLKAQVTAQPDNAYAHFYLATALYEAKRYALALPHYVRALELSPRYLGALLGSGHCLRMLQRWDAAIRVGKQMLLQQPNDADAHYLLGTAYHGRGDSEAAREHLTAFLTQKPEFEVALEVEALLQQLQPEAPEEPAP
ncbi:MAG: tetratricopeptide repeat protein [Polyangiales bacterium]